MAKCGYPDKFISIVGKLHKGVMASIREQQALSDPFPIKNGVKQGCILAPMLFSMLFSAMLQDSCQNNSTGNSNEDLQTSMDLFSSTCNNFGLMISIASRLKSCTNLLLAGFHHCSSYSEPTIHLCNQKLSAVN